MIRRLIIELESEFPEHVFKEFIDEVTMCVEDISCDLAATCRNDEYIVDVIEDSKNPDLDWAISKAKYSIKEWLNDQSTTSRNTN